MTNRRNASSGCFSGIERLLLCKRSLQTHPSDQITEVKTIGFDDVIQDEKVIEAKVSAAATANPGVVARLMGLDSLPDTTWVPKARATPDSVTRSRSVNFMDYLLEVDLAQAQHRRVRTSISFREVPTLLSQQNHDFFVLDLDNNTEKKKKTGYNRRKSEEIKQKNEEKIKNKENVRGRVVMKKDENQQKDEPRRVPSRQFSRFGSCRGAEISSGFVSPCKKRVYKKSGDISSKAKSPVKPQNQMEEVLVESKFMKKVKCRQAIKDLQSECSSEDSSSLVSVLGLDELSNQEEKRLSVDTSPMYLESKTICSPRNMNSGYPHPLPTRILSTGELEPMVIKKNDYESSENRQKEYYTELARKLCLFTEEDIKESNWTAMNIFESECFGDIFTEFGHRILDLLLCQVIEELGGFH